MLRTVLPITLAALLTLAFATPAFAGQKVEGDGYSIRLPDGFKEAMSIEGNGQFKVKSRFGDLPVDGMPEMKLYTFGPDNEPRGVIMLARVNLTRSISTSDELGLKEMEAMRSQLPEGMTLTARKIGKYDAVEMTMVNDMMDEEQLINMLSVACGDYVVVVTFMSTDGAFRTPDLMWSEMVTSLKIEPGVNKVLLFGGIGFGALVLIMFLKKMGSRDTGHIYKPTPSYGAADRTQSNHYDYGGENSPYTAPADSQPAAAEDGELVPDRAFLRDPVPAPGGAPAPAGLAGRAPGGLSAPGGLQAPGGLRAPSGLRASSDSRPPDGQPAPSGLREPAPLRSRSPELKPLGGGNQDSAPPPTPPTPAAPASPPPIPADGADKDGVPKPPARKGLRPTLPASGRWGK